MWLAWELIWRKNSEMGVPPQSLPKDKIYAIWGYPKVSSMEIKSNILFLTTTYWYHLSDDQVKACMLEDLRWWIATQSTI